MKFTITPNSINIPPYVSTSWSQVSSLSCRDGTLVISLLDGKTIEIPELNEEQIQAIFEMHAQVLNNRGNPLAQAGAKSVRLDVMQLDDAVKLGFSAFDELGIALQHNPEQAQLPDLPPEVLERVSLLAQSIPNADLEHIPKSEPNCNCLHCQITRAITGTKAEELQIESDLAVDVSDEDLQFSEWAINQVGDKLYAVTNKLDSDEEYQVYIGSPVGCTCGHADCEHIVAVLKS